MDKTNDPDVIWLMSDAINRLDVLQALLRAPLQVTEIKSQVFAERWETPDEVIVTHRFILILKGAMNYTVEGARRRLTEGTQLFVPAWSRREWTVPKGGCRLLWCAFSSGIVTLPTVMCRRCPREMSAEVTAFEAMRKTVDDLGDRGTALRIEGALKACLARFWTEAQTDEARHARESAVHREVARAMAWLERHYAEPDALEAFYRTVELSPNHFRLLFRREKGETVQAVLARLRLRRARYLVQETAMPMKRIAAETGFADPLYFSAQYRKFWGRAATKDRAGGGVA
ncbi:MAG: helix-turn-helix transcriptional regulator [Opitutaceae bacterium]|nr:helix-turn-helix transcriptional regulator [Opitutaceae bacterium]